MEDVNVTEANITGLKFLRQLTVMHNNFCEEEHSRKFYYVRRHDAAIEYYQYFCWNIMHCSVNISIYITQFMQLHVLDV